MPTYEYECQACGHAFEKFHSITAKSLRKCPVCGKNSLKRLIGTGAGIIFKGSGFYETDYRSAEYKKAADKENGTTSTKTEKAKDDKDKPNKDATSKAKSKSKSSEKKQ